jgi:hypothetical protein
MVGNAEFTFDGLDQLLLTNFEASAGTTSLVLGEDGPELLFDLEDGIWSGVELSGKVRIGVDPSKLYVHKTLFEDQGDIMRIRVINTSDIALDVSVLNIELPASHSTGLFSIEVDGTVTIDGFFITRNSDLFIKAGNDLYIYGPIVCGTANLFMDVNGFVRQSVSPDQFGALSGSGLALMVNGTTVLTAPRNNFPTIAADSDGQILYRDVDALNVGSVSVDGQMVAGFTVTAGNLNLKSGGILSINEPVTTHVSNALVEFEAKEVNISSDFVVKSSDQLIVTIGCTPFIGFSHEFLIPDLEEFCIETDCVTNYSVAIYDREGDNPHQCWDGRSIITWEPLPTGAYYVPVSSDEITRYGLVQIVRR